MLHLSGTPFNLYEDFGKDEIFTWDYISEQQAKQHWEINHPGEKNPYADLPKMNIFTYDITKNINQVLDQEGVFTFNEFFRTWTGNPKADRATMPDGAKGRFVHETEVKKFLDLLCTKDAENNFPFSTDEYRKLFRHTFWVVSGVKEAKALKALLDEHRVFKRFKVINVAGDVETDEEEETALDVVKNAIGELPEQTSTITISCGRLTTGVTVEPWSAVFYLKGGDRAATYMQTIFRVQSPYKTPDGKMKTSCYVFDFSPDRTLKVVAETAKFSSLTKKEDAKKEEGDEEKTQEMRDKETVQEFVKLCPVISMEGGVMSPLNVNDIYKQLENVFIDRLVRKGFDDSCLYNMQELNNLDPDIINHIGLNGGQAPDETRKDAKETVDLSHMTPEQRAAWEAKIAEKMAEAQKKAAEKLKKEEAFIKWWESASDEEREQWLREEAEKAARRQKAREDRDEFRKRITNIRGIALRIPLLMFGGADAGDTNEDITVDNFTSKISDESWVEFMPKGITKEDFNNIRKCFNATRFEEAGKKYRALTREADFMHIEERIKQITEIFSYFHNPDKETVLTPWRVVNIHMSSTLGGWCFYDETFDDKNGQIEKPRFVDQGEVTKDVFAKIDEGKGLANHVLEINSKTGLYPLYVAYTMYRYLLTYYAKYDKSHPDEKGSLLDRSIDLDDLLKDPVNKLSIKEEQAIWDDVISNNLFVICNTPMAVGITHRTLLGFRHIDKRANIKAEKLITKATTDQDSLIAELRSEGFWKGNTSKKEMKFNAVVGNPPYQGNSQVQFYPLFYLASIKLGEIVSMIFPTGWQKPCAPTAKGLSRMNTPEIKEDKQIVSINNMHDIFKGIAGAFETNIILWRKGFDNGLDGNQIIFNDGKDPIEVHLEWEQDKAEKPLEIRQLADIVGKKKGFKSMTEIVSHRSPYGLDSDVFSKPEKYNLEPIVDEQPLYDDDIKVYGVTGRATRVIRYIRKSYKLPAKVEKKLLETISCYKIFFPNAWGNMDEKSGLGGSYSNIIIAGPQEICTQTYNVTGCFKKKKEAVYHAKYLMTRFARALLYANKSGRHASLDSFKAVPIQDYKEEWWSKSIEEIEHHLFNKYDVPQEIEQYVLKNLQQRDESSIINL